MRAGGAGWPAGLLLAVVAWLLLVGPRASRAANVTVAAVQEPGVGHEGESDGEVDEDTDNDTEVPENEPSTEAEAPEEGEGSGSWHVRPPKRARSPPFAQTRTTSVTFRRVFWRTHQPRVYPLCASLAFKAQGLGLQENKHY